MNFITGGSEELIIDPALDEAEIAEIVRLSRSFAIKIKRWKILVVASPISLLVLAQLGAWFASPISLLVLGLLEPVVLVAALFVAVFAELRLEQIMFEREEAAAGWVRSGKAYPTASLHQYVVAGDTADQDVFDAACPLYQVKVFAEHPAARFVAATR